MAAAVIAVAAASIPFAVNGHVGILGCRTRQRRHGQPPADRGLAEHARRRDAGPDPPGLPGGPAFARGRPRGAARDGADRGLRRAHAGDPRVDGAGRLRGPRRRSPRFPASSLRRSSPLPYLAAAYLAQEAFKEPIEALFVLAFALLLPTATTARRAIPLGVIAAGSVYAYSFPGLFWLAGTAAIYIGVRAPKSVLHGAQPRPLLAVGAALVVLLVLTAPDLGRIVDFTGFRAFKSATISGGLGNLRHQVSPLEALGIWPASDFRLSASDASGPTAAFYLGALVAAAALGFGLPRWIRRHGPAVPAALATAIVVYVGARLFGTVYTSAKALVIAAPLVTLISFGGLLLRDAGLARRLLAAALAAGIAALELPRAAPGARRPAEPRRPARGASAARSRAATCCSSAATTSSPTSCEGRGRSRPSRNYYDPNYVKPDLRLKDVFAKFDFDSVTPRALARFQFVITTRAAYASGPPPAFRPVRRTPDFVLWKRTGQVGPRRTLAEGADPGAILDCSSRGRTAAGARRRGGNGVLGAARRRRAMVARSHRGGRLPGVPDAHPAARALGDLHSVRRHPAAPGERSGHGRDAAGQPRLPRLGPVLPRGGAEGQAAADRSGSP